MRWALALALAAQLGIAGEFADRVYPVLTKANCRACHVESGVGSATRLHFPAPDASPAAIESFGRGLAALIDRAHPEQSLLLRKPTLREKHTGGKLIEPGSPEEAALRSWVETLAKLPPEALATQPEHAAPAEPQWIRRLTHAQYNNTVRDLLGDPSSPANQFPQEDFVNGFKNQARAQGMPALLAEAYGAAAEKLARNAFRNGDANKLIPCAPTAAGCRDRFLKEFGLKAFRRPLTARETARYAALFDAEARRGGRFEAGAQLVVEAMLQSPHFLFRVETDRPYAVASRISYSVWDSMPDAELFAAAGRGELNTQAGVEKQVRRMLGDPRARQAVDEFTSQWLRFDRVLNAVKDRGQFRQFTPELATAMTEETRRLVADLVWNRRSFMRVFDSDFTFVNGDLAALYGLPAPEGEFARAALPPESERAGILGQAAFLALTAKPGETSPTARGLFVREQFLCQHVPDPPPGTNANLPPLTEDKPMTTRQRLGIHQSRESCSGCHRLIDPIGFGFEKFDAIGGRREKQKITIDVPRKSKQKPVTMELELDTTGAVAGIPNSDFKSPRELGAVLAASRQCQECVVKQLFRYVYGRPEAAADKPALASAYNRFQASGFQFQELLTSLSTAYAASIETLTTQTAPGSGDGHRAAAARLHVQPQRDGVRRGSGDEAAAGQAGNALRPVVQR